MKKRSAPDPLMRTREGLKFALFFIPYFFLYVITAHHSLFWDTMQFAGDHPDWYWDHNFRYLLLPDNCDSGHPPVFGMYLALVWKILGRSLWASHTAMLPFIALLVYQAVRTGILLFPKRSSFAWAATALVLTESVLLTQCTLVSPDIWLVAFFLTAFNAILRGSSGMLALAVAGMGLLSTRAMMCSVALYLFRLSLDSHDAGRGAVAWLRYGMRKVMPFLPGAFLAIAYFTWHYMEKGWIGYPRNSPWAPGFEIMPLPRIGVNILVLAWRIIDLGKVLTTGVFLVLLAAWWRKRLIFTAGSSRRAARALVLLVLGLFLITALPLVIYQGLLTHRYFMPLSISISITTLVLLEQSSLRRKGWWIAAMILVQLSGHCWTYPRAVSQGWEGTLGHLYYYGMRQRFLSYMEEHGITKQEVATQGMLRQSEKRTDLGNDTTLFPDVSAGPTPYIWYCNVTNGMNKQVADYFRNFEVVKQEKRGHVEMVLFRRRP